MTHSPDIEDRDGAIIGIDPPSNAVILVVEDDTETRMLIDRFLRENGFHVIPARNGPEMWDAIDNTTVHLVLLDIMLPGTSGLDLCRLLRAKSKIPVIILSARGAEMDRVLWLELGADDYIAKPFSRPELMARIRAVLRRAAEIPDQVMAGGSRKIGFDDWILDTARRELIAPDGAVIDLALAAVSHDLRTPITRMRLRAGFLTDLEMQTSIDRDLSEMEAMIEATLAYLSGEQVIERPRPIDLPALLTTLIDAETDMGRAASYEGPAHLTVTARPLALKRAFANLIANAVVYGGRARVRLHLTDRRIFFNVEDDGPGISNEDIKRVFDPFVRLENSRNRHSGGVGLGLTIARQAVTAMGGSLVLENRPGGGLTARVELPAGSTPAASAPDGSSRGFHFDALTDGQADRLASAATRWLDTSAGRDVQQRS